MKMLQLNFIILVSLLARCGDIKSDHEEYDEKINDEVRSLILNEFKRDELDLFNSLDSCLFTQFVNKSLTASPWDECAVFDSKVNSEKYLFSYLEYAFYLVSDRKEQRKRTFYGLGDLRHLRSYSFHKDSIVMEWKNRKLSEIVNNYLDLDSFMTDEKKLNYIHAFIGFIYKVQRDRLYFIDCNPLRFDSFSEDIVSFCERNPDARFLMYEDDCCGSIIFGITMANDQVSIEELLVPDGGFVFGADVESPFEADCIGG